MRHARQYPSSEASCCASSALANAQSGCTRSDNEPTPRWMTFGAWNRPGPSPSPAEMTSGSTFTVCWTISRWQNPWAIYVLVSKLTRILGYKERRGSCNPSKGADGRTITTSTQLLSEWEKFLGTKFQRPAADAQQNIENLPAEDDVLDDDELRVCRKALRRGKATGWHNVPVEAYRGSVEATNELFRICRLMWRTEQIPPDLVRGVFMIIYILQEGTQGRLRKLPCHLTLMPFIQATIGCHCSQTDGGTGRSPSGHTGWISTSAKVQRQRLCSPLVYRHGASRG